MTTNQMLEARLGQLMLIGEGLKKEQDVPPYVVKLYEVALNFSDFAQEVEQNRLEQLAIIRSLCKGNSSLTNKIIRILDYVESKSETTPAHDGP